MIDIKCFVWFLEQPGVGLVSTLELGGFQSWDFGPIRRRHVCQSLTGEECPGAVCGSKGKG